MDVSERMITAFDPERIKAFEAQDIGEQWFACVEVLGFPYAQSLLAQRPANSGHWSDGLANASRQILAAYLMKKDGDQQQAAQDAFLNAMGPQQTGHPGMQQTTPSGYESVSKALRDMPDNPYAGRLNMRLQMAQALQGAQAAEADQGRIGELRTRKVLQNESPFELTERYAGGGQWSPMGEPVPLWKPEKPETDSDILEINQLVDTLGKLPEGDPRREPYKARLTKITSSQPGVAVNLGGGEKTSPEVLARYQEAYGRLGGSQENLRGLERMAQLVSGIDSGFGADTQLEAKKLFSQLGFDVDASNIASAEEFRTLAMDQIMNRIQDTKGAVSEKEMAAFERASPSLANTPEGNKAILRFALEAAKRQTMRDKFAVNFMQENPEAGLFAVDRAVSEFEADLAQQPIFTPEEMTMFEGAAGSQPGAPQYSPTSSGVQRRKVVRNPQTGALEFAQ